MAPETGHLAEVRGIEERAFNAWPALQTLVAGGWLLRFADGYTKRANSVNAWQPAISAREIVAHAAPIYAARHLPLIVRLSPLAGPDADRALAGAGFAGMDETIVMTAPLGALAVDAAVHIAGRPTEAWLDGFARANGVAGDRRAVHDRMLALIAPPAAFACLEVDGRPVAWGLAVAERGMAGLFDIVTVPTARRQGLGRRLVHGLLRWAATHDNTAAYLQVVATNTPALALYRRLGFADLYRYHYRIAPPSTATAP